MWIGERLSKLELLTLHSFLRHGHEFHLWVYDEPETPLPRQVVLEDAASILPRGRIFRKREIDAESGVGRGSLGLFADLFRYKLLYEKGGYWVDMDVTCLKPFDFSAEYVFRTHRVGVVNNILKCPPRSRLMGLTYEQAERETSEDSPWLQTNRILSRHIRDLKLEDCIRPGICNDDDWLRAVKPLVEEDRALPKDWHAIHWINEMWRTLKEDEGRYKGLRYVDAAPDKDRAPAGGTLSRLYREYGLIDAVPASAASRPAPPLLKPAARQPVCPRFADDLHINVLLPNLALGGAERSVVETLRGLTRRSPTANLFVMHDVQPAYDVEGLGRAKVHRLHALAHADKLRTIALETLASPTPAVFTHLVKAQHLRVLWDYGVATIPVVQNSLPSWQDDPSAFDSRHVPFVAAVSEAVAEQLRAAGCPRPVVAVRHELQRWFSLDELRTNRRIVRERHAVPDGTLLIGMVGEFKSQKAYTRAVRVLAEIRRHQPAKLLVVGGWDHDWGNGRAAYAAACRQALDLGVMADFLTPGAVRDVEPYYAAFDVFLNTSVYEGLSVATAEAIRAGCPIVSADAGGNRECLPPEAALIQESADVAAYVAGVERVLARGRRPVPVRPPDADLVPRLWSLLGQYGLAENGGGEARSDVLFLTENLNLGGAGRSLVNLLCRLRGPRRPWLGVLGEVNHQAFLDELETAGAVVFSARDAKTPADRAERILQTIRRLGTRQLVFWNVDARVKLLLAKILPRERVRLIDVSPGPWLFEDLDNASVFQRRITLDRAGYFERLDRFVAKYDGGAPESSELAAGKLVVIPNGVPDLDSAAPDGGALALAAGADPDLVIGTCCRLLPSRRLEYLVDMMAELNRIRPGVSLVVVGAAPPRYEAYCESIQARARARGVTNIHFAGQQADVAPFLRRFRVFVVASDDHGCPNASLEAMSIGLPIVANEDGGLAEQVLEGVNGYLVSGQAPENMARRVGELLASPRLRKRMGAASRRLAEEKFSMRRMVDAYETLLESGTAASARKHRPRAARPAPCPAPGAAVSEMRRNAKGGTKSRAPGRP